MVGIEVSYSERESEVELLFSYRLVGFVADGGCDWNAGVPACNAVASAASNDYDSTTPAPDGRFASVAGETPAFQSHPPCISITPK